MTNFAFVQSDFPMGGTGWDKTNWAAKTKSFLCFSHSDVEFMTVNVVCANDKAYRLLSL